MEIAQNAIKYVEEGYTLKEAAKLLGVGYTTLARFITSNPELREKYYEARARVKIKKKKK
jgi:transposase